MRLQLGVPKEGKKKSSQRKNSKKRKNIPVKRTPAKTTTKDKRKKNKTHTRERMLRAVAQKKCQHNKKIFEKYKHECIGT